ncbi:MAG: hypothetical protein ASARMPREDX12_007059 [Alectoria sarmentosa]|nr:MAG: hypothetical protein ASARMPREDX12_007059 [Alectoria sarmentosa]
MPTGQKAIDWTAENDARLILTILAVENIHPNCENVAAAFGGSVNAMAIANRLSRLRKKAADEGLGPKKGGAAAPGKGRKGNGAGGGGGKGGRKGGMMAEGSDDDEPKPEFEGANTPPSRTAPANGHKVLTGRVTKARGSGKNNAKSRDEISDDVKAEIGEDVLDDEAAGSGGKNGDADAEGDGAVVIKSEESD